MNKKEKIDKIELIDKIIDESIMKIKLLEELKESLRYEKSDYHLIKYSDDSDSYSLFKISHKNSKETKQVAFGDYDTIKSFMKRRKISDEQVFRKTSWEHIIESDNKISYSKFISKNYGKKTTMGL